VSGDPAVYEGLDVTGTARGGQAPRAVPAAIEVSHLTKVFGGRTAVSDVLSIAQSRHTLEDVYLQLVGDDGGRSR